MSIRVILFLVVTATVGALAGSFVSAQTPEPQATATPTATSQPATTQPATSRPTTTRPDQSPVVAVGSRIEWNIPYVEHGDPLQKLDLYAPPDAQAAPVVVFVHGGEWARHDKEQVSYKPRFFNTEGMIFVSVNYRLSGTHKHPAQVEDVAAAVRWLHDHVAEYGGDPHKLVLMGHSAGCHIVTLVGLDARPLAKYKLTPADLAGVVSWSGGAFHLVEKVQGGGMYAGYIRQNFGEDEQAWRDASPMLHVADGKPATPFLFATAEGDNPASREASQRMVALLRQAGGEAQFVELPGKNHSTANHEVGQRDDQTGAILVRFIRAATGGVHD